MRLTRGFQIQQMLVNYELAARKRASKRDAEFDQAFFEADAVLASADLFEECSCLSDSQSHLQSGRQGISFQFRRCLLLQRDLAAVSDAMWRFRPHHELRKHFIYEQVRSSWRSFNSCEADEVLFRVDSGQFEWLYVPL